MTFHFKIFLFVFIVSVLAGGMRWMIFLQTYDNPEAFRNLHGSEVRSVLKKMVDMQKFDDVKKFLHMVYPVEDPSTHGVGHILGEVAYAKYGAKAFGLCDAMFNYGCYHGVVDMAIRTHGIHESLARDLRDACAREMKDPSPCIHPLGHASTILTQYNALAAFHLCDSLYPDPRVAFSCWNGAMMEYINRSAPNAPLEVYGNPNDPYFPCNTFPSAYEASCVSMHVSYLLSLWGHDFPKLLRYCLTYHQSETKAQCVDAVGTLIGQAYFTTPEAIAAVCSPAGASKGNCITGASVPFTNARQKDTAQHVCDSLDDVVDKTACYSRVESMYKIL